MTWRHRWLSIISGAVLILQGFLLSTVDGVNSTATQCPQLVPGLNQTVSSSGGYVGDTVHVTCDQGFALDGGFLSKVILCIDNASTPVWNETLGDCIPKACSGVPLLENMTLTDGRAPFLIGSNVTVTCDIGHAFSVNLTLNFTERVIATQTLTCLDDPGDVMGRWSEEVGNCSVIECSTPYTVENAIMTYSGDTYQSTVQYKCYSGHLLGSKFTETATCNEHAQWEMHDWDLESEAVYCGEIADYIGCLSSSAVSAQESYTTSSLDVFNCIHHCRSKSYRFAALEDDTCICADGLADDYDIFDDKLCNVTCAGYDGLNPYQSVFCGGTGSLSSVYVTLDGCFENITVNINDTSEVLAEEKHTCREHCRAKDFTHAATFNTTCFCMNTSHIDGIKVNDDSCDNSDTLQFLDVHDLAKYQVKAENCSDIFSSGIRMHGTYMLKNGTKTFCNFKDGTICDEGWVGDNGNCYLFYTDVKMNFTTAREFCIENEAEMVSILNAEEAEFLKETRNSKYDYEWTNMTDELEDNFLDSPRVFTDLKKKQWFVGIIDSHNTSLFSWLDGNLYSYSRFGPTEPSGAGLCVRDSPGKYLWETSKCTALLHVVCKKTESVHQCVNVDLRDVTYTRIEPTMSLPYCVEVCRGQDANFSAVSGSTCHCFATIPTGAVYLSRLSCNTPCPGDPYQYCGNTENVTLIEISGRSSAKSCEDLQLVGIGNGSFVIQSENETTLQFCTVPECPYAWLEIRGRCYRFNPVKISSLEARSFCSINDAYPVVLETEQEAEELMNTVANISVYNSTIQWRIGLQSLSGSSGLYRWANGKILMNSLWSNNFTIHNGAEILISKDNYSDWQAMPVGNAAIICEKGQEVLDYVGCYNTSGLVWDYNTTEFEQMTIQQCVEWCRGGLRDYALVSSVLCACSDSLTDHASKGSYCYSGCSGQRNQICGGDDVVSVYNISEYEPFSSQCSDLTDASIFLSGNYVIGGTARNCDLSDSTVCESGWLGYQKDCYKFDRILQKESSEWWYNNNVVMTSLTTVDEEEFLKRFLQRLYLGYQSGKIVTGLEDTYSLRIYSNEDGLLFKPYALNSGYPESFSFSSYVGFKTEGFNLSQHGDVLGYIGKKNRHKIGCYEIPSWLTPALSNFSSMELTLCKQVCLALDAVTALMTLDACYCGNSSLIPLLNWSPDGNCMNACNVHSRQWCGNGKCAIAYNVVEDEAHLAANCDTLYSSGVFYNNTYKLWNSTTTRLETCGFTDDTDCPPAWFGKMGYCYKLYITPMSFENARAVCFKKDSFLFNPTKKSPAWSLLEYVRMIPVLNDTDIVISGIRTIYFNLTYVAADGTRLDSDDYPEISLTEIPESNVKVSVSKNTWINYNPDEEYPFLCQKNKAYLGCSLIHTPSDKNISGVIDMSLTTCSEYCRGQDSTYFATTNVSCHCFVNEPSYTNQKELCVIPCPGADTQICGGEDENGTTLYSLFRINNESSLAKSCAELARFGVRYAGEYYIQPNSTTGPLKVICFQLPPPLSEIGVNSYKQLTVSSSKSLFNSTKTFHEYGLHEVWQPKTNDVNQNIRISLKGIHIITGLIFYGIHTHNNLSWVSKVEISYRDPLSRKVVDLWQNGTSKIPSNSNGIDAGYIFITQPFVTEEVIISPQEWHSNIALKIFLLGQLYRNFSHNDFYIGCVFDYSDMFNLLSCGSGSECDNVSSCGALEESFLAFDGNDTCYCGYKPTIDSLMGFQYGFVNGPCILNGTRYTGYGLLFKALYRTYEKRCETPVNLSNGQISEIAYPYIDNIYTFGANAKYICDIGYEFDDTSHVVLITCRQDNNWDNITQSCAVISCQPFNVTNGSVDISSLEYLGEAHVICDNGLWTENGKQEINVTCEADKSWTITPTCKENNLKENSRFFSSCGKKEREPSTMIVESQARSTLECTVRCTTAYYCRGANFSKNSSGKGTCRLFITYADPAQLVDNIQWKYYETIR